MLLYIKYNLQNLDVKIGHCDFKWPSILSGARLIHIDTLKPFLAKKMEFFLNLKIDYFLLCFSMKVCFSLPVEVYIWQFLKFQ